MRAEIFLTEEQAKKLQAWKVNNPESTTQESAAQVRMLLTPYWPKIKCSDTPMLDGMRKILLTTKVRLLDSEGVYWNTIVERSFVKYGPDIDFDFISRMYEMVMLDASTMINLGIPSDSIVNLFQEPMFVKDMDQSSEEDRLRKILAL